MESSNLETFQQFLQDKSLSPLDNRLEAMASEHGFFPGTEETHLVMSLPHFAFMVSRPRPRHDAAPRPYWLSTVNIEMGHSPILEHTTSRSHAAHDWSLSHFWI